VLKLASLEPSANEYGGTSASTNDIT